MSNDHVLSKLNPQQVMSATQAELMLTITIQSSHSQCKYPIYITSSKFHYISRLKQRHCRVVTTSNIRISTAILITAKTIATTIRTKH
mmetsp:Transcript_25034/g.52381  ORF Transcript_25034/g.52381 Transcript_25034/m.52381 type:complete len:88 (-) Transcript_25034:229-492(-)